MTLAQRSALSCEEEASPTVSTARQLRHHCFVRTPEGEGELAPALLVQWRRSPVDGKWEGWVTWLLFDDSSGPVCVSQWLSSSLIVPAGDPNP